MTNYKNLKSKIQNDYIESKSIQDMRFRLLSLIALETGARVSDLLKLRFADINDNYISYLNHKSNIKQEQRISETLISNIKRFKETLEHIQQYNDLIFFNASKKAVLSRITANRRSQKEYGINFHQLRKESGKNIASQKGVVMASKFLGHTRVSITDIYLGTSKDEFKNQMKDVDI